ncbi:methane monooxygenase/ammonia monooxygenase subunit C [Mycolicibacterium sp. jd]|uniref:Ammonia monooxygenase n=2 Tax=Mycobacteriaceae TaxID=1762 RepID=A0A1Y0CHN4_9MYCO|nr:MULTISPECIES: methane monooxygenase/ammonia monooxygenase subunit C [Mycobacteriaceae]ART74456.1 ammonia monooxygenase [Mycobacterium dioxanotrophicus]MDN4517312.1 methane monooxygenase/ammonia monooxygenase subunit C [Mycolicibacterium austroafricanum]UJL30651.1 ammonia monooxygenase [Mycolicibacterium vanbaalenii]WND56243.1 methane monooxygenase/ammonia monooxygenase subunit C [Mycolicibacterium vanbaalenii]
MSTTERAKARATASRSPKSTKEDTDFSVSRGGSVVGMVVAIGAVLGLCLFWRGWQQAFAFSHGLDKNLPAFTYFWLTLLAFNLLVLPSVFAIWYLRMWKSAGNPAAQITRQQEGKRLWNLWLLTLAFTVAVFFGGSFFAEEDASWHQVVIRDTAFTPSHIVLFFGIFPLLIYLAAGIYIYGRTNLPHMYGGRRFPVSIGLIIGGSVLLLFQVAMNEFGHSFFTPEELFVAPLHWPFVIFGYLLAGTFAIWFETLPRIGELARQEQQEHAAGQGQAVEQRATDAGVSATSGSATAQAT